MASETVGQRHRDAAADLVEARYASFNTPPERLQTPTEIRTGQRDWCHEVQAFARFEATLTRPVEEGVREALAAELAALPVESIVRVSSSGAEFVRGLKRVRQVPTELCNRILAALALPAAPASEVVEAAAQALSAAINRARNMVPDDEEGLAAAVFAQCLNAAQDDFHRALTKGTQHVG